MYLDVYQTKQKKKHPPRRRQVEINPSKNKPDFNFKLGQFGLGIIGERG
jgi:hypothetical protein